MAKSDFHLERLGSHNGNLARIILKRGSTTVGRILSNNIVCASGYVSRKHCVIIVTEKDEVKVKLESTINGIFINGHQNSDVNSEILLRANDIIGIGCDTSNDEINNKNCFVFQLKRKECEVISLVESDDEKEETLQELYSQRNLVEMKLELMELDEFLEECSRIKTEPEDVELLPNVDDIPVECVSDEQDVERDIFENIILNSGTYAEKTKLINGLVPDVAALLKKDVSTIDCKEIVSLRKDVISTEKDPVIKIRRVTVSLSKIDVSAVSNFSTKAKSKKKNKVERITTVHHMLPYVDDELTETSNRNVDSIKEVSSKQINGKIMIRRHTVYVPSLNEPTNKSSSKRKLDIVQPHNEKINEQPNKPQVNARIINRRHSCYLPPLNEPITKSSLKRKVEVIDAPHMAKRRKSISCTLDNFKRHFKKGEDSWISKRQKSNHKNRTKEEKEEIKSKLAAIAVSHKEEKVVEIKTVRKMTKIPVKNTHKSRNDYLTDTIDKSAPGPSLTKSKRADTYCPPKISNVRIAETISSSHSSNSKSVANIEFTSPKSDESTTYDLNGNSSKISFVATTTTSVKSILKKPNQITRRRSTVSFSDHVRAKINCQPKTAAPKPDAPKTDTSKTDNAEIQESTDDVLTNIMLLGVPSIKKSSNSPQINGKNFNYQVVADQYESLKQLQNVFIPLMKTELWKEIEDGFSRIQNQPVTHVQLNYYIPDEDHRNRYMYRCQTHSPAAVQVGSLILVSNVKYGKDFLGYIVHRQITNQACFFDFISPFANKDGSSYSRTVLTMKPIMYIRPNLKVFDALFKLKTSPLLQHVLQPALYCSEPPVRLFKYMGFNALNDDQMTTLNKVYQKFIATRPFISLIEGPPGTGKSRLITNLVVQLLYGNEIEKPPKILVCAPSNAAIDIITKNLLLARKNYKVKDPKRKKMKIVRFGVLEKMGRSVRCASIQELIKANQSRVTTERERQMKCKTEMQTYLDILMACNFHNAPGTRKKIDSLRKSISAIDASLKKALYDESALLENADIICTTLNSCCTLSSKISSMDICIIDEATQCNEPTSLIPLQFNIRGLVLVGDTKQLASTVVSEIAKQYNYDQSLFQRLQKSLEYQGRNAISQLNLQYRMHPDILHWPNEYFYKNRLVSANSTKTLSFNLKPYTIIDLNFNQSTHSGEKHIANIDEANFVRHLLNFLITKADPKSYSYGIISAYSQQKDDLARDLGSTHPFVTVNTIDSCQGQERDIIIISIARSRGIGFLAIRQRLNVALTRARKMLILCGNFNMLQSHSMWNKLLDDAKQRQMYIHFPTMNDHLYQSYFEKYLINKNIISS